MGELEKLGTKYRIALRIARDERWERLKCDHSGVYADDCLVDRYLHYAYVREMTIHTDSPAKSHEA